MSETVKDRTRVVLCFALSDKLLQKKGFPFWASLLSPSHASFEHDGAPRMGSDAGARGPGISPVLAATASLESWPPHSVCLWGCVGWKRLLALSGSVFSFVILIIMMRCIQKYRNVCHKCVFVYLCRASVGVHTCVCVIPAALFFHTVSLLLHSLGWEGMWSCLWSSYATVAEISDYFSVHLL